MLAGRSPADEQGDDDRGQVPGACAAGQLGGLLDVGLGVGGADTGDGHARGFGQVGQPVGARLHMLAGVGEQQPDVAGRPAALRSRASASAASSGSSAVMTPASTGESSPARPEGIDVVRAEGVAAHDVERGPAAPTGCCPRSGLAGLGRRRRSPRRGPRSPRRRSRRGTRSARVPRPGSG